MYLRCDSHLEASKVFEGALVMLAYAFLPSIGYLPGARVASLALSARNLKTLSQVALLVSYCFLNSAAATSGKTLIFKPSAQILLFNHLLASLLFLLLCALTKMLVKSIPTATPIAITLDIFML